MPIAEAIMWRHWPPFEPVGVLNFQFILTKGILNGCKLLAVLEMPLILMSIKILLVIPVTNSTYHYETEVIVVSAE